MIESHRTPASPCIPEAGSSVNAANAIGGRRPNDLDHGALVRGLVRTQGDPMRTAQRRPVRTQVRTPEAPVRTWVRMGFAVWERHCEPSIARGPTQGRRLGGVEFAVSANALGAALATL